MNKLDFKKNPDQNNRRSLIFLMLILVGLTLIYQLRLVFDDSQFMWISVPAYSVIPGILVVLSIILTVKDSSLESLVFDSWLFCLSQLPAPRRNFNSFFHSQGCWNSLFAQDRLECQHASAWRAFVRRVGGRVEGNQIDVAD